MHDVQVDFVDAEPPEALLSLGGRVLARGIELGGDEHLLARQAALAQRLARALLVPVGLGGVDVPVPKLERPAHGPDSLGPVRYLPDSEPQHRHLASVRERAQASVCGH